MQKRVKNRVAKRAARKLKREEGTIDEAIRWVNQRHNMEEGKSPYEPRKAAKDSGPFQDFYQRSLAKGIKSTMARLTLARKIAAITLTLWKKGENFDADKLKSQAA